MLQSAEHEQDLTQSKHEEKTLEHESTKGKNQALETELEQIKKQLLEAGG